MKWIGLSGGIATGKSTVSNILRDLGLPVVDADQLAREAMKPGTAGFQAVVRDFGQGVLNTAGEIDRKKLAQIVFQDSAQRLKLEQILHPQIQELRAKERRRLEQAGCEIAFYDVPLLFEKNLESEFDATILVYAKPDEQRQRLKTRENWSAEHIESRLKAQMPIEQKMTRAKYIILNQGSLAELKANVLSVLHELLSRSSI